MAEPNHLRMLDGGVAAWNAERSSLATPDLRGADLSERKLGRADLHTADLS